MATLFNFALLSFRIIVADVGSVLLAQPCYPYCLHRWSPISIRVLVAFVLQDAWGSFLGGLCRIGLPLFYIPSPSDVGIVFLLGLTTTNCLLILSPRVVGLLPYKRAFHSRDCLVIIYGSITTIVIAISLRHMVLLLQLLMWLELGVGSLLL